MFKFTKTNGITILVVLLAVALSGLLFNKYQYDSRMESKINDIHRDIKAMRCHETGVYEYPS